LVSGKWLRLDILLGNLQRSGFSRGKDELSEQKACPACAMRGEGKGWRAFRGRKLFTIWGFCDGKQAYVMMDGNVFPVFCVQHQFYVLGSKQYRNPKVNVPMFIPLGLGYAVLMGGVNNIGDNVSRTLSVFRLDVQSGQVKE
jgi:hypothetical protein